MPGELLEYIIRVVGGQAAAARVAEVGGAFDKLAASEERAGLAGASAAKKQAAGAASMGASFKKFGMVGAGALVAVGLESVKMANKFDTEMLKIRTEGGATTKEFHRMKFAVNDMAKSGASMGQGPVELSKGLYHLESMGLRSKTALKALKLASEEAAISGSHLEDTTTAIGGALFVAMKGTGGLSRVMNVLNGIAGAGNMRFQQLNEALGTNYLGAAKLAGLSIQEAGTALAVLTHTGMPASSAAAQLGTAFHFLYAPGIKAAEAMKKIHLSGKDFSRDLHGPQGLSTALGDLQKHLAGLSTYQRQDILNAILPGGRGKVLLQLLTLLNRFPKVFRQISEASKTTDFGRHVMEQAGNASTKTATALAKFQGHMVDLGHQIGPDVNALKNFSLEAGVWMVNALTDGMKALDGFTRDVMRFRNNLNFNPLATTVSGSGTPAQYQQLQKKAASLGISLPAQTPAQTRTVAPPKNTGAPGHQPGRVTTHARTSQVHPALATGGDIVIQIAGHEFARVTRREIQKAMMAGS